MALDDGRITAFDLDGVRPGWPVPFTGTGSPPAFGADGRIYLTVSAPSRPRTTVLAFDALGGAASQTSPKLPIWTNDPGVDCAGGGPYEPALGADGTVFVWHSIDERIYALDASLDVRAGWPYRQPEGSPPDRCAGADGLCCDWARDTARSVGPDGTLYLALQRATNKVGGSITAIDRDGRVRSGWPVALRRPAAMFTAIEVGDDVVYALAREGERGGKSSATILAIGLDGTVRFRTTIYDP
jgi:hypothetical protein